MTLIEKVVLGLLVIFVLMLGFSTYKVVSGINEAGGVEAVIIEAGKGIKDIAAEIEKHEPQSTK